jgi:hypothetical protein
MSAPPFPPDFYGVVDVPFHRFLDVGFTRADPHGPAIIRIPVDAAEPPGARSPVVVFAAAEIGAAIAATDAMWPHVAETGLRPILLTTGARMRMRRSAVGEIRAHSRFAGDSAATFARLTSRRKARCAVEVDLRDEADGIAADARVDLYLRLMSADRWMAMSGSATAGPGRERVPR